MSRTPSIECIEAFDGVDNVEYHNNSSNTTGRQDNYRFFRHHLGYQGRNQIYAHRKTTQRRNNGSNNNEHLYRFLNSVNNSTQSNQPRSEATVKEEALNSTRTSSTLNASAAPFIMPSTATLASATTTVTSTTSAVNDTILNNNNRQQVHLPRSYLNNHLNNSNHWRPPTPPPLPLPLPPSVIDHSCISYLHNQPNYNPIIRTTTSMIPPNLIFNRNSCIPTTATTTSTTSITSNQQQQHQPNVCIIGPTDPQHFLQRGSSIVVMQPSTPFTNLQHQHSPSQRHEFCTILENTANHSQQQQNHHHHHHPQQQQQPYTQSHHRPSSSRLHPQFHRLWLEQQDRQEQHRRQFLVHRPEDRLRDHNRMRMNLIESEYQSNVNSTIHGAHECLSNHPNQTNR